MARSAKIPGSSNKPIPTGLPKRQLVPIAKHAGSALGLSPMASVMKEAKAARKNTEQVRQERFGKRPEVKAIIERLTPWCGSVQQAKAWFEGEKIPALGNRTAKQSVEEGYASAVLQFLDHAASGGFA